MNVTRVILFCLLLSLTAVANPAGAQPAKRDPYFTPTSAKSTAYMPRVIIRSIREDRAGNIWFATFGGPIRYDGKTFTNFAGEVGLPRTRIFSLLEDRSGALWFGSITGGATRYDGKTFTRFTDKEGLGNNDVTWLFEDRDGQIWFGTGNGVSRYDGKTMTNFTTKDGLIHNAVYTITQDASGRIWFGTQGGVCSYDGKSFANLADRVGRSFVNVRSMVVDRVGNLWFGGQQGAFRYDGKALAAFASETGLLDDFVGSMIVDKAGNVWMGHPGRADQGGGATRYDGKSFRQFTHKEGLCCKTVYCMQEDTAGNIWFGSIDAGACRYDGKSFTHFSATTPNTKPAIGETVSELSKSIWSVFQDKNSNYWFGSNGDGVYRYDGKTLTQFTTKHGLPGNQIRGVQQYQSGDIFINTTQGISKFDGRTFTTLAAPANTSPMTEWKLQPDDLWFAGAQNSDAVFRYDGKSLHRLQFPRTKRGDDHYVRIPRSKFPNAKYTPYDVYTIYRDRRGHMWFGTADLGAVRFDGKTFDWLYEDHLTNVPEGGSFGIRSIIEDKKGKFWFCNTRFRYNITPNNPAGNGLVEYQQENGIGDLKARLGEDHFYFASIIDDKKGELWMSTYNEGVWRYDGKTMTHYPVKDGTKEPWIQSIYQDNHGDLWLGTDKAGVFKFNGKTFEQFNPAGQDKSPDAKTVEKPTVANGEIVSEMPKDLGHVFQAKDGLHWFSSGSEGAFRYDGKTITRFTKKDGLAGDGVGGVQEDKSGNLYFSTNGGISKFDGRSFMTLEQPKATGEWKNQPDDLWFAAGQDTGAVFRYDGKSLHRLAFPKTKAGDDATLPRDKFPNAKYSPYDVYTIFKDSKGHLWFGTAVLGACRYDGKSFNWIPEEELRNDNFGLRSIIEYKDGKLWFSNTLHRYAVDLPAHASQWYRKEKGIGDLSGHKQGEYSHFMSSTLGDDGAMWMAILGGVVYRYDGKSMTRYPITENGKHHWIFSIYKDNQGVLWLGTQAHGAYRFNGKSFEKFRP